MQFVTPPLDSACSCNFQFLSHM